jgi:hypothetical protein
LEVLLLENLNKEEWQQIINEYRSSGLSALVWCQQKKISVHKLRYWIREFNNTESQGEAAQQRWVSFQASPNTMVQSVITVKIGNAEVSVSEGFNKELFSEVVLSLLSLC